MYKQRLCNCKWKRPWLAYFFCNSFADEARGLNSTNRHQKLHHSKASTSMTKNLVQLNPKNVFVSSFLKASERVNSERKEKSWVGSKQFCYLISQRKEERNDLRFQFQRRRKVLEVKFGLEWRQQVSQVKLTARYQALLSIKWLCEAADLVNEGFNGNSREETKKFTLCCASMKLSSSEVWRKFQRQTFQEQQQSKMHLQRFLSRSQVKAHKHKS